MPAYPSAARLRDPGEAHGKMSQAQEEPYDDSDRLQRPPTLAQELGLGMMESLLNSFVDLDPETRQQVRLHSQLVVRVKTADPHMTCYMHFTSEGIELSSEAPGPAQVRISGSTLSLLSVIAGRQSPDQPGRLRIWGENSEVSWLINLLKNFNLRTSAQRWLRQHLNIGDIWQKIRHNDPSWMADLMPVPGLMRETLAEIRGLRQDLEQQQDAWRAQQAAGRQQGRQDILVVSVIVVAVALGMLPEGGIAGLGASQLVCVGLGLALVASRFWRR